MQAPPYEQDLPPYSDDIPRYSASLEFYGFAWVKTEFDTPWNSRLGVLQPVVAELNSNQLRLYEFAAEKSVISVLEALFMHQNFDDGSSVNDASKESNNSNDAYLFDGDAYGDDSLGDALPSVLLKFRKHYSNRKIHRKLSGRLPREFCDNSFLLEPTTNQEIYRRFSRRYRGKLMHCFTLQNLAVGEAPSVNLHNYKEDHAASSKVALLQYRNALRLRIEHMQLLLHFWLFNAMVHWFRNLQIGRDLASLLDTRVVARFKSIPRNFSSRNNALLEAAAREASAEFFSGSSKPRLSVASEGLLLDQSSFSSMELSSENSLLTGKSSVFSGENTLGCISVYGNRIVCYENMYTPAEKQYISNCIPTLNSFDKWSGSCMTLSNYAKLLPKNDAQNINENGKVFISLHTFNSLVKGHLKRLRGTMTNKCMEFYVDDTGLVSVEVRE